MPVVPRRAARSRCLAVGLALFVAAPAAAQIPPVIPVEHFFDSPEIAAAQISPDGRWLAYLKPYRGKLNVFVRPVGTGEERRLTADTLRPIREYYWSADGARVLYLQDRGGNENFHIFAVGVDAAPGGSTPLYGRLGCVGWLRGALPPGRELLRGDRRSRLLGPETMRGWRVRSRLCACRRGPAAPRVSGPRRTLT